jgi:hypothetical protein
MKKNCIEVKTSLSLNVKVNEKCELIINHFQKKIHNHLKVNVKVKLNFN